MLIEGFAHRNSSFLHPQTDSM